MTGSRPRLRGVSAGTVALAALVLLALGVILVPALASRDPLQIDDVLARRLVAPFGRDAHGTFHLMGTDRFGRDLFVRMMLAGQLSLLVGVVGAGLSGLIGTHRRARGWRSGVLIAAVALEDFLLACPPRAASRRCALGAGGWTTIRRAGRTEDGRCAAGARRGDRGEREAIRSGCDRVGGCTKPRAFQPRAPERDRARTCCHYARRRKRDSARERAVIPRPWDPASSAELGEHDRGRSRPARDRAVGGTGAGDRAGRDGARDSGRRRVGIDPRPGCRSSLTTTVTPCLGALECYGRKRQSWRSQGTRLSRSARRRSKLTSPRSWSRSFS